MSIEGVESFGDKAESGTFNSWMVVNAVKVSRLSSKSSSKVNLQGTVSMLAGGVTAILRTIENTLSASAPRSRRRRAAKAASRFQGKFVRPLEGVKSVDDEVEDGTSTLVWLCGRDPLSVRWRSSLTYK